jgi:3-deoxy-D-manno-octulosonic-acid transferase
MKKTVRLTESDLVRLVKKVLNEQSTQSNSDLAKYKSLGNTLMKKYGCNKRSTQFDPQVKEYQELKNKLQGKTVLKVDGLLGPKTLSDLCPA